MSIHDLQTGTDATVYTIDQSVAPASLWSGLAISANGRFLAFSMKSPTLFGGSTAAQVVLIDREDPENLEIVSIGAGGIGNGNSYDPQISFNGRYVLFNSQASNLSPAAGIALSAALIRRDRFAETTTTAGSPGSIATLRRYVTSSPSSGEVHDAPASALSQ